MPYITGMTEYHLSFRQIRLCFLTIKHVLVSMLKKEKQVTSPQDVKCVADDIGHMLRDKDGGSVELGECSTTSISTNCKLQHGQQQAYHPAHQTSMKNDCSTSQIGEILYFCLDGINVTCVLFQVYFNPFFYYFLQENYNNFYIPQ